MILTYAYNSSLYSMLTVPTPTKPLDSIAELEQIAHKDSYNILVMDSSSLSALFKNAQPDNVLYYEIGRHLNRLKIYF